MWLAAYPACRLWRPRGRRYDPHNQPPLSPNAHHSQFFGRPNTLNSALSCGWLPWRPSFLNSALSCGCCQRQPAALCASLRLRTPSSSTGRGVLRRRRYCPFERAGAKPQRIITNSSGGPVSCPYECPGCTRDPLSRQCRIEEEARQAKASLSIKWTP